MSEDFRFLIDFGPLAAALGALAPDVREAAASGLYEHGQAVMADSQENYVPVDESILKGSGFVEEPVVSGDEIRVELGYGGPAQAYARAQHENKTFHHTVGEAEYLRKPMLAAAPSLPIVIADAVGRVLERRKR